MHNNIYIIYYKSKIKKGKKYNKMNGLGMRPGIILLREGTDTSQVCFFNQQYISSLCKMETIFGRYFSLICLDVHMLAYINNRSMFHVLVHVVIHVLIHLSDISIISFFKYKSCTCCCFGETLVKLLTM
jgi:hypothetical protein